MRKKIFILGLILCLLCATFFVLVDLRSTNTKLIALTFDDGPAGHNTIKLLDGLAERNAKVTFFLLGKNIPDNKEILERAFREGHQLASHSWDHPELTGLSKHELEAQIQKTNDALDTVCGKGTRYLLRPPYGYVDQNVSNAANAPIVLWSVDPLDWQYIDANKVRDNIVREAYDGAIVLVHDTNDHTIDAALMVVDALQAQGYEFVTVDELFRRRGVALENGKVYEDCKPGGTN